MVYGSNPKWWGDIYGSSAEDPASNGSNGVTRNESVNPLDSHENNPHM